MQSQLEPSKERALPLSIPDVIGPMTGMCCQQLWSSQREREIRGYKRQQLVLNVSQTDFPHGAMLNCNLPTSLYKNQWIRKSIIYKENDNDN